MANKLNGCSNEYDTSTWWTDYRLDLQLQEKVKSRLKCLVWIPGGRFTIGLGALFSVQSIPDFPPKWFSEMVPLSTIYSYFRGRQNVERIITYHLITNFNLPEDM
jgi:hypothetical protein